MKQFKAITGTILLMLCGVTAAQNVTYVKIGADTAKKMQKHYQLTDDEMKRYQDYMEVEGYSRYQHLDPVMVLGIIAKTQEDRYRFAKKYIDFEGKAIESQNQFGQAVEQVAEDMGLFDDYKAPKKIENVRQLQAKDELFIVINSDCEATCRVHLTAALTKYFNQDSQRTLTVYLKDGNHQNVIDANALVDRKMSALKDEKRAKNIRIKAYDEFEFKLNELIFNRVMVKRGATVVGLYQ